MPAAAMSDEVLLEQAAYLLETEGRHDAASFIASVKYLKRTYYAWDGGAHDDVVLYVPPERYRAWTDATSTPQERGRDLRKAVEDAIRAVSREYDDSQRNITLVRVLPVPKRSGGPWREALNENTDAAAAPPPRRPMDSQTLSLVADLIAAAEEGRQQFAAVLAQADLLPEWERKKLRQALEILFGSEQR